MSDQQSYRPTNIIKTDVCPAAGMKVGSVKLVQDVSVLFKVVKLWVLKHGRRETSPSDAQKLRPSYQNLSFSGTLRHIPHQLKLP